MGSSKAFDDLFVFCSGRSSSFYETAVPDLEKAVRKRNFDNKRWGPAAFFYLLKCEYKCCDKRNVIGNTLKCPLVFGRNCGTGYPTRAAWWWRLLTNCCITPFYSQFWKGDTKSFKISSLANRPEMHSSKSCCYAAGERTCRHVQRRSCSISHLF